MTHARPDVPQPDPIVHDQPGDVPQVPCADELDEHKPGSPMATRRWWMPIARSRPERYSPKTSRGL